MRSPRVSVTIITRNRPDELADTVSNVLEQSYPDIDLLIVENGSDAEVVDHNQGRYRSMDRVRYIVLEENLGVSGGRRVGLEQVNGDYIIEIDDDAVFVERDAIATAVDYLEAHLQVGILAFKITNYHTRQITPYEYPFRDKGRDPDQPGPCTWFIGAGHAFRRELIERVGTYRDFFPWGSEEQDLALRALDVGYEIIYLPDVHVLHKKSPNARIDDLREFTSIALKNRVKVALLNLPWYSAISYFLIRGIQLTLKTRDPIVPLRALRLLIREADYVRRHRSPIRRETRRLLARRNGQLYY